MLRKIKRFAGNKACAEHKAMLQEDKAFYRE